MNKKEEIGKLETHIGQGSIIKGELKSAGGVRIDGEFEGNIDIGEIFILGRTGKVKANGAKAKNAILGGVFNGKLDVSGKVELEKGAHFDGEIHCKVLSIEEGVIFNGQCIMEEKKTEKKE